MKKITEPEWPEPPDMEKLEAELNALEDGPVKEVGLQLSKFIKEILKLEPTGWQAVEEK